VYIAEAAPFEAAATATFPGHKFLVRAKDDQLADLHKWVIKPDQTLYTYDPFEDGTLKLETLKPEQLELYNLQKNNLKFAEQYKAATGIDWLSLYPRRPAPINPMWSADYFGQEHSILSRETHFNELPNPENLVPLIPTGVHEPMLKAHRDEGMLNMTLKVLSCSPRVFEIQNFLSKVEIDHIMQIATGMTLHQSSTKAGIEGESRQDSDTRTSRNSWVVRGRSPIIDAIYRRSADLMQVDEAYMRTRTAEEMPDLKSKGSNSEQLQLVHYDPGQQYTPHHDFAIPTLTEGQPMRFSTILLYLNEGMEGGETTFPRWLNAESTDRLKVKPEVGKAVLFYSLLPDGNMDDLSQHAAEKVGEGEKWLINLWTWDPQMRF
jgi:prolyl 4-hydroxylase